MKETTSVRLKRLLSERNLRQVDILEKAAPYCKKYGVKLTKSDLSQYVSGKFAPGQDKLSILGLALNVSEAWLMGYDVPMERSTTCETESEKPAGTIPPGFLPMPEMEQVPLIGSIACGTPILAEQNIEGSACVPARWRATFSLICKGDSMEPKIHDGDLVAIRKQPEVENGEIAAVRIGEEATLKRVYKREGFLELRPENSNYESIILIGEKMAEATIEGKAVGLCRDI